MGVSLNGGVPPHFTPQVLIICSRKKNPMGLLGETHHFRNHPILIWVFPKIGVPQNGWFTMENPIKMDDLGVPLFSETSIYRPYCYKGPTFAPTPHPSSVPHRGASKSTDEGCATEDLVLAEGT